jgi:DnaJ-class molecular chaperone
MALDGKVCPNCNGSGQQGDDHCNTCGGTGRI